MSTRTRALVTWLLGFINGAGVVTFVVLVSMCAACDFTIGIIWGGEHGEVFECETPCTKPNGQPGYEWCWNGSESELERLKGDTCDSTNPLGDRFWPALVGCAYGARGAGCNAHCGCFVPQNEE